jgi:hypothetical protein
LARPSQVQALLDHLRKRRDQAARERGIAAHPHAMLDAIGLAIGAGHERAEEVLRQALHKVETRELPVWFASNLNTWREKFAEWHPGPAARPWLRVSPDECEALGNAEGCAPDGEVPRSPGWRINTVVGLAERQDERGAWRPVGPVVVDGEALRKLAVDHVATARTDAAAGAPNRKGIGGRRTPDGILRAEQKLLEWLDQEGEPPTLAEIERKFQSLIQEEGETLSEQPTRARARKLRDEHRRRRQGGEGGN